MVSFMLWPDADMALLANDGQRELDEQRVRISLQCTESHCVDNM